MLFRSQFDVFWVAGIMTLPWLFVGIAASAEVAADCTDMDTPIAAIATPDNLSWHGAPKGSIR